MNKNFSLNNFLNLDFDYFKLGEEEEFNKYMVRLSEINRCIKSLPLDFYLFRMLPVMKERFPGLKGTPIDFKGVVFKEDEPRLLVKTRITIEDAMDYNSQITNSHSIAGYGKYYLLRQPGKLDGIGRRVKDYKDEMLTFSGFEKDWQSKNKGKNPLSPEFDNALREHVKNNPDFDYKK